jgi:hypothetical protein
MNNGARDAFQVFLDDEALGGLQSVGTLYRSSERSDRSVAIEVISDSELDHRLLIALLPSPAWFRSVNVIDKLVQNLLSGRQWDRYVTEAEAWHLRVGVEHHALVDARIMARAFVAAKDWDRE